MGPGSLDGKTVLIFGGSSGMGKAAAISVYAAGGIPFIIGRDVAKLEAAKAEIQASSSRKGDVKTASVDLNNEAAIAAFFDGIEKGSVHHLVATVGGSAGCSSIIGASGFAKLKAQFDLKFLRKPL